MAKAKKEIDHPIMDVVAGVLIGKVTAAILGKLGKGVRRLLFRWRRILTPVWFASAVWLVAVLARALVPTWWACWLVLPVFGITLGLFGPKLSERWSKVVMKVVPAGLDKGKDGVMDRPLERIYFASLVSLIGLWLAVRTGFGPSALTGWSWKAGLLAFGGSWWYHRRIRVVGRADRFAKKWSRLTNADTCPDPLKPLVGSKVLSATGTGKVAVLRIRMADAGTVATLTRLVEGLESFFRLRPGSIKIKRDKKDAGIAVVTFLPGDPWAGMIPHPLPAPGTITLAGMRKRISMGLTSIGEPFSFDLSHILVIGKTGGGKSAWLHALFSWLVAFRDGVVVGIDFAGGATMGVWKRAFAMPLATNLEDAIRLLNGVLRVIEAREAVLGLDSEDDDDAADEFQPTEECPWLFLVIDEFADMRGAAKAISGEVAKDLDILMGRIGRKARKCGVRIILATQNGTKADLGTKEFQAQFQTTVSLMLDELQSKNLWGTLARLGWNSLHLGNGQFLLRNVEHDAPEVVKGYWVTHPQRKHQAVAAAALDKRLEKSAWAALRGSYVPDSADAAVDERPDHPILDALAAGPLDVAAIMAALTSAGTDRGTSRAAVYKQLGKLRELGHVHPRGQGVWAAGADTRNPQERGDAAA